MTNCTEQVKLGDMSGRGLDQVFVTGVSGNEAFNGFDIAESGSEVIE
ncbi:hypothetical protein ACUNTK_005112 [Pseudomonas aeruginosa]